MKTAVVIPAYNVGHVLEKTIRAIPAGAADMIIVVDDGSSDATSEVGRRCGATVVTHDANYGYGAAQMSGFSLALKNGADIVVLLHGDNQYAPELVGSFVAKIRDESFHVVTGSRMLLGDARRNGMPGWKYFFNRLLTCLENIVFGTHISDYHDGYRGYSALFLRAVPFVSLSRKYDFDTDMLVQAVIRGERICEIPHPTRYARESSAMRFGQALFYGARIGLTMVKFVFHRWGVLRQPIYTVKK